MDHQAALDQHLTERYLLGELSDAQAAEFEAHFFECEICAQDIARASRWIANLKAVLREDSATLELRPQHQFVDLTILLRVPALSPVECELLCKNAESAFVVASRPVGKSIQIRVPVDALPDGPCTIILREEGSRNEIERRQLLISKNL